VDEHIEELKGLLEKGDIIIDGGNSFATRTTSVTRRNSVLSEFTISMRCAAASGALHWLLPDGRGRQEDL
jgi:6-phosphogluconate dehydrogenase